MNTLEMMTVLPATDFWSFCSEQWINVAAGAREAGDRATEGFFRELARDADYIGSELGLATGLNRR